jgi:hypothetical protein
LWGKAKSGTHQLWTTPAALATLRIGATHRLVVPLANMTGLASRGAFLLLERLSGTAVDPRRQALPSDVFSEDDDCPAPAGLFRRRSPCQNVGGRGPAHIVDAVDGKGYCVGCRQVRCIPPTWKCHAPFAFGLRTRLRNCSTCRRRARPSLGWPRFLRFLSLRFQ